MPHVSGDASSDNVYSSSDDAVTVFKEEGEGNRSNEDLNEINEEKHDLIDLSESEVSHILFITSYCVSVMCVCVCIERVDHDFLDKPLFRMCQQSAPVISRLKNFSRRLNQTFSTII